MGVRWDFEYIRECIKINKIRFKFHFWQKEEKRDSLRAFFYRILASRAIWKPFCRRLRFWVVLLHKNIVKTYFVYCHTLPYKFKVPTNTHRVGVACGANGCNNSKQCWDLQCIVGRIQPIRPRKPCVMRVRGINNVGRAVQTDPTSERFRVT